MAKSKWLPVVVVLSWFSISAVAGGQSLAQTGSVDIPPTYNGNWNDQIDIALPTSPGSATPNVALLHQHNISDGVLGTGFSLAATSVITRHGPLGGVAGRHHTLKTSQFRMDGELLIRVDDDGISSFFSKDKEYKKTKSNNIYGSSSNSKFSDKFHFKPEHYTGARLRYEASSNTWIKENRGWQWVFGSKSGTGVNATKKLSIYDLGFSSLSVGDLQTKSVKGCADGSRICETFAWYLSRARDPSGNEITFDYEVKSLPNGLASRFGFGTTHDHLLTRITYASGLAAVNF